MWNHLKRQLKELIGQGRHEEAFRRLRDEVLDGNCSKYNELILILSRYEDSKKTGILGLIPYEEQELQFNNVNQALLWLIDRIEPEDLHAALKKNAGGRKAVPLQHALTCNRHEQKEMVELNYYDSPGPGKKIRHFFLYGDVRQEHKSLFRRLGYELGGFLLNWEQGDYNPGTKVKFVDCKPAVHRNAKLFLINVLRELFARFSEPVNNHQPILQRTIKDLLNSSELQGFGSDDLVFILLTIDDHNWEETVTPAVVRTFIETFCNCELPEEAPAFFLFFGIEYQRENQQIKEQVKKAIDHSVFGEKLPELQPVRLEDISEWLSRYTVLLPPGREAPEHARNLFPEREKMDMIDVEVVLRKLIDDHNKQLL